MHGIASSSLELYLFRLALLRVFPFGAFHNSLLPLLFYWSLAYFTKSVSCTYSFDSLPWLCTCHFASSVTFPSLTPHHFSPNESLPHLSISIVPQSTEAMKLCEKGAREDALRFKLRSERIHQQVATKRRRNLYVQRIDSHKAWLFIETEVTITTTQHKSNGRLKEKNMTKSKSNNHGIVSKYCFRDLVKPIYSADIPHIIEDFRGGMPIQAIQYSKWADCAQAKQQCGQLTNLGDSLFASSHKNCTFTTRLIKSVTNLLGFGAV